MARGLSFSVQARGFERGLVGIEKARLIVQSAFRDQKLRAYLLKSVKDRFAPAGSNPRAQTSPEGVAWARPAISTVISRKVNRTRFNQALVDTSALRRSIKIIETRLSDLALSSSRGGIRIGVPTSAKAAEYATVLNFGGRTPKGSVIPARRFLGIGNLENRQINRILQKIIDDGARGIG